MKTIIIIIIIIIIAYPLCADTNTYSLSDVQMKALSNFLYTDILSMPDSYQHNYNCLGFYAKIDKKDEFKLQLPINYVAFTNYGISTGTYFEVKIINEIPSLGATIRWAYIMSNNDVFWMDETHSLLEMCEQRMCSIIGVVPLFSREVGGYDSLFQNMQYGEINTNYVPSYSEIERYKNTLDVIRYLEEPVPIK